MSATLSATSTLIESYEDKKRAIQEWIHHTPTPTSGGLVDAFSPPSTTPSTASLNEEFDSEEDVFHRQQHSQLNSESSSDTFVILEQPRGIPETSPQYLRQFIPQTPGPIQQLYSPPLPIAIRSPLKPVPISPIQQQLASLGPLKQHQLANPIKLPLPMATYVHSSHHHQNEQPIVIDSPRKHRSHRHRDRDREHKREYDDDHGHGHRHHHRHRSPSPVRSRAQSRNRSRARTRSRSQLARARHIDETPQFLQNQSRGIDGADDDNRVVLPADYRPVSGSGGGGRHRHRREPEGRNRAAEKGEGMMGKMMGKMGRTTSRPQGQGGTEESQPGPINHSSYHQPSQSTTVPTSLYQNIGQLAGAAVGQYIQGKVHGQHGHAHHPSHSHQHHDRNRSPSRHRQRSRHSDVYPATVPTRPLNLRRRSKSVDERNLGGYRSRVNGHPVSSQMQHATTAPIATNQPVLVPINHGRGGWAVVPPVGQEIRVVGSPTNRSIVPSVHTSTVLHHSSSPISKSKHHRSRSAQPQSRLTESPGFFRKLFGIGKKESKSSDNSHRAMEVQRTPVQYVDPGRHGARGKGKEKERGGRNGKRRRESY